MILSINHQLSALNQLRPPLIKMDKQVQEIINALFGGKPWKRNHSSRRSEREGGSSRWMPQWRRRWRSWLARGRL